MNNLNFELPVEMLDVAVGYLMDPDAPALPTPQQALDSIGTQGEQLEEQFQEIERVAMERLKRLSEEALGPLAEQLRQIEENDPNAAARSQLPVLRQAVTDIGGMVKKEEHVLEVSERHLYTRVAQNTALQNEVKELQKSVQNVSKCTPFRGFVKQGFSNDGAFMKYAANPDRPSSNRNQQPERAKSNAGK